MDGLNNLLHLAKMMLMSILDVTKYLLILAAAYYMTLTVQVRDPCKQPDPCPPPPKDDRAFWGAMAILFTMGCFGVYAKHTPEVRDWLTIYANWYDDLIAIAYQENMTYAEHALAFKEAVQEYLSMREPPKLCDSEGKPIKQPPKPTRVQTELANVCPKPEDDVVRKKPCPEVVKNPSLKEVCEIQKCLMENGESCLNNYWTAKEACRVYNQLVEDNLINFTYERLKELRPAMVERFRLLNEHACAAAKHLKAIENTVPDLTNELDKKSAEDVNEILEDREELDRIMNLECGVVGPKEILENTKAMIREALAKAKVIQTEYVWEADRSVSMDQKWQYVEKIVNQYVKENEIMFPGTVYDNEKPSITGGTDLLLMHTIKYKNMLEEVLKASSQATSERADRGVATLPQEEKLLKAREQLIQTEFRKKQAALDQWYKKKLDWQKGEVDKELKRTLAKMKERHESQLVLKLKEKEEEATKKLNKLVKEAVDAQKKKFALELKDMSLKVLAVETKLNVRLKAEREAKRSQKLWSAAASLLAATKKGDHHVCVAREIRALEAATGDQDDRDKLVLTVLKSIPEQVRKEGLVPESVLRERYFLMEKTAKDVALVEQEGSPMPIYIISWLQSALLFMKLSGIPQKDIDNPVKTKKELQDLDTFDRLNYARYWIEQGNLAHALRYVDSLEGASRVAADPWYKDAKSHLEIKQAAEAVIAHATALALQYI